MWLLLPMLIAAGGVRAQVAPGSRCERALSDALRRSRAVEVSESAPELRVVLRDVNDGFALELQRPNGERLLQRELPANPQCRDVAFAIVLVVERFLRGIDLRAPPAPAPQVPDAGTPRRAPPPSLPPDAGPRPPEPVDAGQPEPEPETDPDPDPDPGFSTRHARAMP